MNKTAKKKWLKALRSEDYKQGTGCLKRVNENGATYCCLGVLMDTLGTRWRKVAGANYLAYRGGSVATLSPDVKRQVGLSDDVENKLIEMNDTKRRSFKQIAGYIERYL